MRFSAKLFFLTVGNCVLNFTSSCRVYQNTGSLAVSWHQERPVMADEMTRQPAQSGADSLRTDEASIILRVR
jgi:hypothetical protein